MCYFSNKTEPQKIIISSKTLMMREFHTLINGHKRVKQSEGKYCIIILAAVTTSV